MSLEVEHTLISRHNREWECARDIIATWHCQQLLDLSKRLQLFLGS